MIRKFVSCGFFAFIAGCSDGGGGGNGKADAGQDAGFSYPDPAFVYSATGQTETAEDAPFLWEKPRLYRTVEELPDLDVTALSLAGGGVWAGTASGLFKLDAEADKFAGQPIEGGEAAVTDVAGRLLADGRLVVGLADRVVLHDPDGASGESVAIEGPVRAVATDGTMVWAGTQQGVFRLDGDSFAPVAELSGLDVRDLAVDADGNLWCATASGLRRFDGAEVKTFDAVGGALPDDDVRAVAELAGEGVLAGCATGAAVAGTAGDDRVIAAGAGALPYDDLTSVAACDCLFAFGHGIGATVTAPDLGKIDYYHSLRWIPAERVTSVAIEGPERWWIGTNGGVSRIDLVETTLEERAARFEDLAPSFWRLNFVSDDGSIEDAWNPAGPVRNGDHDNDGLWSQMQIVAWSYASAATGDPKYCDLARRAMRGMMDLIDIPARSFEAAGKERGFVARSYCRDDEGGLFTDKSARSNWHLVEDYEGRDYYWKDDTSSDETTGHFFGYPVYYDLCAEDDEERAEIAGHAAALARHIVENGFRLIDLDGERTTFGHWDPDTLAIALDGIAECKKSHPLTLCAEARFGGGWLNGIEILGHLLAAWHMTGERYFYDAYERLVTEHRYAELVDFKTDVLTVTDRAVANHSDHELAFLAYHTLIRYEPDEERRQRWIKSMIDMAQYELPERNPLWSAIIAGFSKDGYYLEAALRTLREWPEDWRDWLVDNSRRKDAEKGVNDRHGDEQFATVLPYDERCIMKWNTNPYDVAKGGDGRGVQGPWPWLLPYWMYRYHGIIR